MQKKARKGQFSQRSWCERNILALFLYMITEILSGPVNASGENKATCHSNPESRQTRIRDEKPLLVSKKRHSDKEMAARSSVNSRPRVILAEVHPSQVTEGWLQDALSIPSALATASS